MGVALVVLEDREVVLVASEPEALVDWGVSVVAGGVLPTNLLLPPHPASYSPFL